MIVAPEEVMDQRIQHVALTHIIWCFATKKSILIRSMFSVVHRGNGGRKVGVLAPA